VPPAFAKAAVVEAIDAGIPLVVVITEGIPSRTPRSSSRTPEQGRHPHHRPELPRLISPGSPTPASSRRHRRPGPVGLVSKSGTLTYQMMYELRDYGFSSAVGIGGDPIIGTTHIDCLEAFQNDPDTDAIVMIGEIGGDAEERAAAYIKDNVSKPVVGYVAGSRARGQDDGPRRRDRVRFVGHRRGQAGGLEAAGVKVGKTPSETAALMREIMASLDSVVI
jgi:succinyl-CoA synthetase alpha subunit